MITAAAALFFLFKTPVYAQTTSTITWYPQTSFNQTGTFLQWYNFGYNGNGNCTSIGNAYTSFLSGSNSGVMSYMLAYLGKTTPGSAGSGTLGIKFYATTTAENVTTPPSCSDATCPYSQTFSNTEIYELPYSGDPNNPTRSTTPDVNYFVNIGFAETGGVSIDANRRVWIISSIGGCSGSGAINYRFWFATQASTGAISNWGFDGEVDDVSIYGSGNGTSASTLPNPSIYDINSTSTASAQFKCDNFDGIGKAFCNAAVWLFLPDQDATAFVNDRVDSLKLRIPWGWFEEASSTIMGGFSADQTTSSTDQVMTIPANPDFPGDTTSTVKIFNAAEIKAWIPESVITLMHLGFSIFLYIALLECWIHLGTGTSDHHDI